MPEPKTHRCLNADTIPICCEPLDGATHELQARHGCKEARTPELRAAESTLGRAAKHAAPRSFNCFSGDSAQRHHGRHPVHAC